jgi:hypothetical protein
MLDVGCWMLDVGEDSEMGKIRMGLAVTSIDSEGIAYGLREVKEWLLTESPSKGFWSIQYPKSKIKNRNQINAY